MGDDSASDEGATGRSLGTLREQRQRWRPGVISRVRDTGTFPDTISQRASIVKVAIKVTRRRTLKDPELVKQGLLGEAASTCRALLHRTANRCSTCFLPSSRLAVCTQNTRRSDHLSCCTSMRFPADDTRDTSTIRVSQPAVKHRDQVREQVVAEQISIMRMNATLSISIHEKERRRALGLRAASSQMGSQEIVSQVRTPSSASLP